MAEEHIQELSFEQIKEHNNKNSTWIVVSNDVYDVTKFLNEHPGGEEVLIEQAGKDASEAFEDVGHSSDAREMMKKYKVGTLIASERKAEPPKKSTQDWESTNASETSSLSSWIVPVVLGLIATVIYRMYFMK